MTLFLLLPVTDTDVQLSFLKCLVYNVTHSHFLITASDQAIAPDPLSWTFRNSVGGQEASGRAG